MTIIYQIYGACWRLSVSFVRHAVGYMSVIGGRMTVMHGAG
jgi:hypothetical protein